MFDSFDNSYIRIWHTSMTAGFPPGALLPHRNLRRATPSCLIRQRGMGGILRSVGVQPAATISSCLTLTSSFRQRKRRPPFWCRTKAKHKHAEIFYDGRSVALTSLLGKCVTQRACQEKKKEKKKKCKNWPCWVWLHCETGRRVSLGLWCPVVPQDEFEEM